MLRIGIVGFGFMGKMHFGNWSKLPGVTVAAICDGNPDVLKDADQAVGNIEGLPECIDFSQIHFYNDFEEMLKAEQLDAVSITLPSYLHKDFSIMALKAGVHVLCEKPMALVLADCDEMIAAAKAADRELMVAHCIRFWPEYVKTKEIIDSGQYGEVLSAVFRRLSTAPIWSSDNWMMDQGCSGGMVLDLHIHDTDYIHYVFGVPKSVCSHAAVAEGRASHIQTQYDYENGTMISAEGSWMMSPSFGFEMSFNVVLEKATIVYNPAQKPAFRVCPAEGKDLIPDIQAGDGYFQEISHFADKIQGKEVAEVITQAQSKKSIQIAQAELTSALEGRKIEL